MCLTIWDMTRYGTGPNREMEVGEVRKFKDRRVEGFNFKSREVIPVENNLIIILLIKWKYIILVYTKVS